MIIKKIYYDYAKEDYFFEDGTTVDFTNYFIVDYTDVIRIETVVAKKEVTNVPIFLCFQKYLQQLKADPLNFSPNEMYGNKWCILTGRSIIFPHPHRHFSFNEFKREYDLKGQLYERFTNERSGVLSSRLSKLINQCKEKYNPILLKDKEFRMLNLTTLFPILQNIDSRYCEVLENHGEFLDLSFDMKFKLAVRIYSQKIWYIIEQMHPIEAKRENTQSLCKKCVEIENGNMLL